jgi:thiamine-phosphate pyrophosphorylase
MTRASLYLITPPVTDPAAFRPLLEAALEATEIACVLLRLATSDETLVKRQVKVLAGPVQQAGAALLLEAGRDSRLAARAGADGVHVTGLIGLDAALEDKKAERIVGVSGLKSRHDCMEAGEDEVDYLMFGEPKPDGYVPPLEQTVERCQWWAEVFQIPCVGYADRLEHVAAIVATGAEFVALGAAVWDHPEGPAAALRAIETALVRPA